MARAPKAHVLNDEVQRAEIITRVKRAQGQVAGVVRMLEEGRTCEEIVHQMAAVSKAVNTAAMTLIAASLQECVQADSKNNGENLERLKKLFLSLA